MKKKEEIEILDEELDKIIGEIKQKTEKPRDEWEECVSRLENYCSRVWICIPLKNNKLIIGDLKECSNKMFFDWMCRVYPPAKKMEHKSEDYKSVAMREAAFFNIVNIFSSIKFPLNKEFGNRSK